MNTLTYLGGLTIGDCLPSFVDIYTGVLGELQAKLAGLVALAARLDLQPPTLSANLDMAIQLVTMLEASINLGLPGVDFQIAAVAALMYEINARLTILLGIDAALGSAGVHAYVYDGTAAGFGATVTASTSGGLPDGAPSDHVNALLLATSLPATWVAMGRVFVQ